MSQLLGFVIDFALSFADAAVGVLRWSGRYSELAARVEPPRNRPEGPT